LTQLFSDLAEAVASLRRVDQDYEQHCVAVRTLAEQRYDGDVTVPRLLGDALT
jgi:hypothetical protein